MTFKLSHHHLMIDANINRFKEGARVLEDLARFVLNDYDLFLRIKNLKHRIHYIVMERPLSEDDIGGPDFKETPRSASLLDIANANALRMQEAARVLEETYDKELYKTLRFASYDLHAEVINKLSLFLKKDKLAGTYAICNPKLQPIKKIASVIEQNHISVCEVRMAQSTKREIINAVVELQAHLPQTLLIVNEHLDVALACADGVHLGQEDFPLEIARKITPSNFIIGLSCHTLSQAQSAEKNGANYISVDCDIVAIDALKNVVKSANVPVCAMGDINASNIDEVKSTQVAMIAMSQVVWEKV
ncbi:MAG: thiamine phosphate synthase [Proteobacteria bacterium]|nr:thiamine phosphate synthase [Pseudomonadota bacterium]